MSWSLLVGIRIVSRAISECDTMNVRNDGKVYASYCGAFQNLMYPWSESEDSQISS